MKKIIIALFIIPILTLSTMSFKTVRCVPDANPDGESCWWTSTSCTKQADGSGGSHCGTPADPKCTCCCEIMPQNTGNGQLNLVELPISSTIEGVEDYKLYQTDDKTLMLFRISTGDYTTLGNISNDVEGKWYRFQFSNDMHTLKMSTLNVTLNENGELLSHELGNTRNFDL